MKDRRFRVLELYAGIGGVAAALAPAAAVAEVAAAVDVHRLALDVHARNFDHPVVTAAVESLSAERLRRWDADLWWMSPPCQPFTRRGLGRDADDPRARSFLVLLGRLAEVRPRYLALENVPPFQGSRVHRRLLEALAGAGYGSVRETVLCPSELGVPNRRRRFYLVAAREDLVPATDTRGDEARRKVPLRELLDRRPPAGLDVDRETLERYRRAIDVVDASDPDAVASCFTSAYGRSPVRSGSYLATSAGARFFSPAEVLRLLGFPDAFDVSWLGFRDAWRLAGNSLSVTAVRAVLAAIPELAALRLSSRAEPAPEAGR